MMMTMIGALIVHHFLIEIAQLLDLSREFWFISYVVASKFRQINYLRCKDEYMARNICKCLHT